MIQYTVNDLANAIIFCWATWCVLSPLVKDGIICKFLLSCAALSAFACTISPGQTFHMNPELSLNISLALLALRHFYRRRIRPALRRRWLRGRSDF